MDAIIYYQTAKGAISLPMLSQKIRFDSFKGLKREFLDNVKNRTDNLPHDYKRFASIRAKCFIKGDTLPTFTATFKTC